MKKQRFMMNIEKDVYDRVRLKAFETNVSMSSIINRTLKKEFAKPDATETVTKNK